jgi:hypothetical protein
VGWVQECILCECITLEVLSLFLFFRLLQHEIFQRAAGAGKRYKQIARDVYNKINSDPSIKAKLLSNEVNVIELVSSAS